MSEPPEQPTAGESRPLPPLSYSDYREFRRLLRMLDVQQHLNLSAHLYSSYLISRLTHNRMPHRAWAAWPLEDAPVPPQIMDAFPTAEPGVVGTRVVDTLRARATESYPQPPDPDTDARLVLLHAAEEVLRRIVHRRIHNERSRDIEAVVEPEPVLGGALSQVIVSTVDKYITRPPEGTRRKTPVSWQHLGIKGPARQRLKRLFYRDLRAFDVHIDGNGANDHNGDTGASARMDVDVSPSNSPSEAPRSATDTPHSRSMSPGTSTDTDDSEASSSSSISDNDASQTGFTGSDTDNDGDSVASNARGSEPSENDSDASSDTADASASDLSSDEANVK